MLRPFEEKGRRGPAARPPIDPMRSAPFDRAPSPRRWPPRAGPAMSAFSSVSTVCTTESRMAYISCVDAAGSGTTGCSRMLSLNALICSSGHVDEVGDPGVGLGELLGAEDRQRRACRSARRWRRAPRRRRRPAPGRSASACRRSRSTSRRPPSRRREASARMAATEPPRQHAGVVAGEGQDRQAVRGGIDLVLGDEAVVDVGAASCTCRPGRRRTPG